MRLAVFLCLAVWITVFSFAAANSHSHHSGHSGESAGGHKAGGKKYSEHATVKKGGHSSAYDEDKGRKGEHLKELHKKDDEEKGGKKTEHIQAVTQQAFHKSGSESQHGAKFEEGEYHNKANYKKGFREKYHKDEEKKHDSFYSNAHKSGEYEIFGQKGAKHSSNVIAKKDGGNYKKGKSQSTHGKSSKKAGGHSSGDHKGHQSEGGSKSHHSQHKQYGKKGGKNGGKQYKYKVPGH